MCSRPQVSATEDGTVIKDTSVVLEIPAPTTVAYGVIELYVKLDGQFGECRLLLGALGRWRSRCGESPHLPLGYTLVEDPLPPWGSRGKRYERSWGCPVGKDM